MIRSFSLFNFSRLEFGVTRIDGETDGFFSPRDVLDFLTCNDDVRLVMSDVEPEGGFVVLGPSSAECERNAT
jgi:hypothetical protein